MTLKKKRTAFLKDPQLREIRANLRKVIKSACRIVQHKILDEIGRLEAISNSDSNDQNIRELYDKESSIEDSLRASILECPVCFKSDKDMTFNPVRKVWYCTDCYEKLRKVNIERGTPEEFP
jgi:hypothetical protein